MKKSKAVQLGSLNIYENGCETWIYPHPTPINIVVADNKLYINGKCVYPEEIQKRFKGNITEPSVHNRKMRGSDIKKAYQGE